MGLRQKIADRTHAFVSKQPDNETFTGKTALGQAAKGAAHVAHWFASGHSARTPSPTAAPRSGALPGESGWRGRLTSSTERLHDLAQGRADETRGISVRAELGKAVANTLHFVATARSANHAAPSEPVPPDFRSDALHFVGVDADTLRDR